MKHTRFLVSISIIAGILAFQSCKREESSISPTTQYLDLPSIPYSYNQNVSNVATLGRVLFYDTHLSVNNAISCATCHKQTLAFSDNVALSRGFENRLTLRNTLPIQNINSNSFIQNVHLFWDGRETDLQDMVLKPVVNHIEMGMRGPGAIEGGINSLPYYPELFTKAYGNSEITASKIAEALAAFTSSIFSFANRFDNYISAGSGLTGQEVQGMNLFFTTYNCNSCHQTTEPNAYQSGGGFVNIGLDLEYTDNGLGKLNGNSADNGKFKIPNLRNIELTAPYMHDGRFATLEEVLDHYSHGIADHPNLDARLQGTDGHAKNMNIPDNDKAAIIAFMKTLTDPFMITDVRFSNPFKTR